MEAHSKVDAIVEDQVAIGLDAQEKDVQEQNDCIYLYVLVNHLVTVRLSVMNVIIIIL